jgi:hypothetical protein
MVWMLNISHVRFDGVHVLDVMNMPEDLLYNDIPKELHVYNTHYYFNTI